MWYIYILKSVNFATYYIGVTSDIRLRLKEHNSGLSKSTAFKRPWVLVRLEKYSDKSTAYKREKFLKSKRSRKIIEHIVKSAR